MSLVQASVSAQSPFVRQQPAIAALVHTPVAVLHVSAVQAFPSLHWAGDAQQPTC